LGEKSSRSRISNAQSATAARERLPKICVFTSRGVCVRLVVLARVEGVGEGEQSSSTTPYTQREYTYGRKIV
jgi:hypothetical protein